jgi:hypothetical protein
MYLKEIGCEVVEWIHLTKYTVHTWILETTIKKTFGVRKKRGIP